MTALAVINRESIIERVSQGHMLADIAHDLGVKPPNISKHLAKDPEYQAARELGAEIRLDRAYKRVEEIAQLGVDENGQINGITSEQGNLARVRESALKAAQWFAEREFPHRWGKTTELHVSGTDLGERIRRARERVIEGETVSSAPQQIEQK